jgi:hypothetical protein
LKKFNRNNKFYKLAIHKKPGEETWYDSTDERMTDREKDVFSLGAPKVIETIRYLIFTIINLKMYHRHLKEQKIK